VKPRSLVTTIDIVYQTVKPQFLVKTINIVYQKVKPQSLVTTIDIVYRGGSRIYQVRGGALIKIAPSEGRRENIWGISCEK
jgi:alkyl sulfatase BDS1-like metallo-beta-lactamase superfamily hydrolase